MPLEIFLMVLGSALLHATWNAMVKSGSDRPGVIRAFCATQLTLSLCLVPFVGLPDAASWPYLLGSAVVSTGYWLLLNRAYDTGELSLVYPLARGMAPLVVAFVSVGFLGEHLSRPSLIGVVLIALGILSLALTRGAAGLRDLRTVGMALATGGLIGGYTLLDGLGVRAAGNTAGYVVWVQMVAGLMAIATLHWRPPAGRVTLNGRTLRAGILSGAIGYLCSWIVLWAFTQAPIALVSALRETGIVFAVIIGVVFLKERLSLARLASIATTLVGTTILKVSR